MNNDDLKILTDDILEAISNNKKASASARLEMLINMRKMLENYDKNISILRSAELEEKKKGYFNQF